MTTEPETLNYYAFCFSNPLNFVDLDGHAAESVLALGVNVISVLKDYYMTEDVKYDAGTRVVTVNGNNVMTLDARTSAVIDGVLVADPFSNFAGFNWTTVQPSKYLYTCDQNKLPWYPNMALDAYRNAYETTDTSYSRLYVVAGNTDYPNDGNLGDYELPLVDEKMFFIDLLQELTENKLMYRNNCIVELNDKKISANKPLGTELVTELIKGCGECKDLKIYLKVGETTNGTWPPLLSKHEAYVTISAKGALDTLYLTEDNNGKRTIASAPLFIALAHEAIHAINLVHGQLAINDGDDGIRRAYQYTVGNDEVGKPIVRFEFREPEEWRTVGLAGTRKITENSIRKEHGLGIRVAYDAPSLTYYIRVGSKMMRTGNNVTELPGEPFIQNGRILVPIRVAEQIDNVVVDYESATKKIIITIVDDDKIEQMRAIMTVGSSIVTKEEMSKSGGIKNSSNITMDVIPLVKNGVSFIPLRHLIVDILDMYLLWNNEEKTACFWQKGV